MKKIINKVSLNNNNTIKNSNLGIQKNINKKEVENSSKKIFIEVIIAVITAFIFYLIKKFFSISL
ncbi:hypothetical protein [uncultured Fusobacterium sp.]|uniref:hypothetical protein n=1 Tax=uncultured Fusobacterium sp. TaxID=159267 RepID=UPI0025E88C92|nr:hypothetical protein [uncultured Fusobacterium sp.]